MLSDIFFGLDGFAELQSGIFFSLCAFFNLQSDFVFSLNDDRRWMSRFVRRKCGLSRRNNDFADWQHDLYQKNNGFVIRQNRFVIWQSRIRQKNNESKLFQNHLSRLQKGFVIFFDSLVCWMNRFGRLFDRFAKW